MNALFFDLDDTLVDTSETFDIAVLDMVSMFGGQPVTTEDLKSLRATGGYNDDWDAATELLRLQGKSVERDELAIEGLKRYLELAANGEELMVDERVLLELADCCPLFIVTGRTRAEFEPVWGARLSTLFLEIVCKDDNLALKPKPSPDQVLDLMTRRDIDGGFFVGNSVDDMRAGKGAGLVPVGVTTNQTLETLRKAGAEHIFESPNEFGRLKQMLGF